MKMKNKMLVAGLIGLSLPAHAKSNPLSKNKIDEIGLKYNVENFSEEASNAGLIYKTGDKDDYTIDPIALKSLKQKAIENQDQQTYLLLRALVNGSSDVQITDPAFMQYGTQDGCGGTGSGSTG